MRLTHEVGSVPDTAAHVRALHNIAAEQHMPAQPMHAPRPCCHSSSRVVVDDRLHIGLVEARREVRLSHGQADGIADTLAQGTCTGPQPHNTVLRPTPRRYVHAHHALWWWLLQRLPTQMRAAAANRGDRGARCCRHLGTHEAPNYVLLPAGGDGSAVRRLQAKSPRPAELPELGRVEELCVRRLAAMHSSGPPGTASKCMQCKVLNSAV